MKKIRWVIRILLMFLVGINTLSAQKVEKLFNESPEKAEKYCSKRKGVERSTCYFELGNLYLKGNKSALALKSFASSNDSLKGFKLVGDIFFSNSKRTGKTEKKNNARQAINTYKRILVSTNNDAALKFDVFKSTITCYTYLEKLKDVEKIIPAAFKTNDEKQMAYMIMADEQQNYVKKKGWLLGTKEMWEYYEKAAASPAKYQEIGDYFKKGYVLPADIIETVYRKAYPNDSEKYTNSCKEAANNYLKKVDKLSKRKYTDGAYFEKVITLYKKIGFEKEAYDHILDNYLALFVKWDDFDRIHKYQPKTTNPSAYSKKIKATFTAKAEEKLAEGKDMFVVFGLYKYIYNDDLNTFAEKVLALPKEGISNFMLKNMYKQTFELFEKKKVDDKKGIEYYANLVIQAHKNKAFHYNHLKGFPYLKVDNKKELVPVYDKLIEYFKTNNHYSGEAEMYAKKGDKDGVRTVIDSLLTSIAYSRRKDALYFSKMINDVSYINKSSGKLLFGYNDKNIWYSNKNSKKYSLVYTFGLDGDKHTFSITMNKDTIMCGNVKMEGTIMVQYNIKGKGMTDKELKPRPGLVIKYNVTFVQLGEVRFRDMKTNKESPYYR